MHSLHIFTDGGSRSNPGKAASAFVVYDQENKIVAKSAAYLGIATNNQAEYQAVILAFKWLKENKNSLSTINNVDFFLDSELVVKQLKGVYKIKDKKLIELSTEVKHMQKELLFKVNFTAVRREQNKIADQLVNECLDAQ